jgi:hypothetical protein
MFYHSLEFLRFLASFIRAEPLILLCREEGRLVGTLPTFIKRNSRFGSVLNSLPFFGSHGGAVVTAGLPESTAREAKKSMLRYLASEVWKARDITFSTIITTPYEKDLRTYEESLTPQYVEDRTTQMVSMPLAATEDELLRTFEKRCRGSVKGAVRDGVSVRVLDTFNDTMIRELYKIHHENAEKIGAVPKPRAFFEQLSTFFVIHRDYDVYIAQHAEQLVAALLVFYFKDFAEYYMPAVKSEYRSLDATNLLVLKAMAEAARRGLRIWNFGGTRKDMRGLYMFKRSFGARDYQYHCLTSVLSDAIESLNLTPSDLREAYEWFYAVPYSTLSHTGEINPDSHRVKSILGVF